MQEKLIYMPTFRVRQEEVKVLKSFDFGNNMYPLLEIVKGHDRVRVNQKSFQEIHLSLINSINAEKVFVDLPLYLSSSSRSLKPDILSFVLSVINNRENRTSHIVSLSEQSKKIIPVISSYRTINFETSYLNEQYRELKKYYPSVAIRIKHSEFANEWAIIEKLVTSTDFIILDIDNINAAPDSPALRDIVNKLEAFDVCHKIILRSALNNDIQNKTLQHDSVVYEADNGLLERYNDYGVNSIGDYVGVKKDYMTSGGGISPGFIYFDSVRNQYFGYTYTIRELANFKDHIVPSVLKSEVTRRMHNSEIDFLANENLGWTMLNNIYNGLESGKNQAKFKRISMEHYIFSIKKLIESGNI